MKNKYLIIVCLLSWGAILHAQGIKNNGASIVVKQGAEVVIDGNDGGFTNQTFDGTDGQIFLDGRITMQGNWFNNAGGTVFANPDETGLVVLGKNPVKGIQQMGGSGVSHFENLTVNSGTTAKILADAEIRVMYNFILNGTLDIYGDLFIEGTFTNNGEITGTGTVHYESTSPQVVAPGWYPNLVLNNPGGLILSDSVYVETELVLSQGSLVLGDKNLVLGPNCIITETKAPGTWVDATGTGMVIKLFDKVGTFEFPVGNFGTTPVYSPVTVEIISAAFDDAQISVRLKPEVHPDNNTGPDFPNYLTRYWVVEAEGLSDVEYNIRFDYSESDVVGTEAEIEGARFIVADGLWKHFPHVNSDEHYFEALNQSSFSVFTGVMENRNPEIAISYPADGGSVYDTTLTVTGTAYDIDGDLWEVYLRVNDGSWQLLSGKENWSLKLPLSFGNWKFEAKAVDYQDAESVADEHSIYAGVHMIPLLDHWSHFSSFLDPIDPDIESIMQYPVGQNLITVMVNNTGGIYWPPEGINTIGNWNPKTAYKINIDEQSAVLFKGDLLSDRIIQYSSGPKYLPVLSNVEVPVDVALENPQQDVLVMYNHITNEIYWPDGGIYTLTTFKPGDGYLANFVNPVTVTFPEYDMTPANVKTNEPFIAETGPWQMAKTGEVHLISLFKSAFAALENYAYIGAFNATDDCIGFANITEKDQNVLLTVYGDNPYTSYKDGAETGELLSFRAYDAATGLETVLEATYNESFPNYDGLFASEGLSAIVAFKEGATGLGGSNMLSQIRIYPNPAKDELNLIFDNMDITTGARIALVSSAGSVVLQKDIVQKHTKLDIQQIQPGLYVLKIFRNGEYLFRKIVVQ